MSSRRPPSAATTAPTTTALEEVSPAAAAVVPVGRRAVCVAAPASSCGVFRAGRPHLIGTKVCTDKCQNGGCEPLCDKTHKGGDWNSRIRRNGCKVSCAVKRAACGVGCEVKAFGADGREWVRTKVDGILNSLVVARDWTGEKIEQLRVKLADFMRRLYLTGKGVKATDDPAKKKEVVSKYFPAGEGMTYQEMDEIKASILKERVTDGSEEWAVMWAKAQETRVVLNKIDVYRLEQRCFAPKGGVLEIAEGLIRRELRFIELKMKLIEQLTDANLKLFQVQVIAGAAFPVFEGTMPKTEVITAFERDRQTVIDMLQGVLDYKLSKERSGRVTFGVPFTERVVGAAKVLLVGAAKVLLGGESKAGNDLGSLVLAFKHIDPALHSQLLTQHFTLKKQEARDNARTIQLRDHDNALTKRAGMLTELFTPSEYAAIVIAGGLGAAFGVHLVTMFSTMAVAIGKGGVALAAANTYTGYGAMVITWACQFFGTAISFLGAVISAVVGVFTGAVVAPAGIFGFIVLAISVAMIIATAKILSGSKELRVFGLFTLKGHSRVEAPQETAWDAPSLLIGEAAEELKTLAGSKLKGGGTLKDAIQKSANKILEGQKGDVPGGIPLHDLILETANKIPRSRSFVVHKQKHGRFGGWDWRLLKVVYGGEIMYSKCSSSNTASCELGDKGAWSSMKVMRVHQTKEWIKSHKNTTLDVSGVPTRRKNNGARALERFKFKTSEDAAEFRKWIRFRNTAAAQKRE